MRITAIVVASLFLGSCASHEIDREQLKEEIRREILAELARPKEGAPSPAVAVAPAIPAVADNTSAHRGSVSGSITYDGVGLAECRVKLVKLSAVGGLFPDYREEAESIVTTDSTGAYRFEHVAPGRYRLKWQPKGESGWIRKSHDRPDVDLATDASVNVKAIETNKPTIPTE